MSIKDTHYIVPFTFIDDFRCMKPLVAAYEDPYSTGQAPLINIEKLESELKAQFKDAGWEGDGKIECIFIPPCFMQSEDTFCETVFHVKQSNNGISWLAIPFDLKLQLPGKH